MPILIWEPILVMIKIRLIYLLHDPAMALMIVIVSTRKLVIMLHPYL